MGLVERADEEGASLAIFGTIDDDRGDPRATSAEQGLGLAEDSQNEQNTQSQKNAGGDVAGPYYDADGRDRPDGRRGREPGDLLVIAEDRAGAEKSDASNDLRGDARRFFSAQDRGHGDHGENGRAHADEDLCAQAGRLVALLALESDDGAAHEGH